MGLTYRPAAMGKGAQNVPQTTINRREDFHFRDQEEPHAVRKAAIIKAHPEVTSLMGHEWRTKYIVAATVALQVGMAFLVRDWPWIPFLAAAYVIGATANHSLFLAIHELSHNLGFKTIMGNRLCGMLANLPIGIAYSVTFKPYHMEHHRYQGEPGVDTDIPTAIEGWLISTSSFGYVDHTLKKIVFMFMQIFGYAFRPMIVKPALVPKDMWIVINWAVQLSFDAAIVYFMGNMCAADESQRDVFKGVYALMYLLISTFLAGSIHPTAGHFLAEHYVMEGKTETYSYYGPLNMLAYNVGYHNELHDFPNIPWSRLPEVRKIAPEFYDHLPQCQSWPGCIFRYIFDASIGPFSRVKRGTTKNE